MPKNIPGIQLSEKFFRDAVRPILRRQWPTLKYSAALIGHGSDVLGFDDAMSRDHEWGPRVRLFVDDAEFEKVARPIHEALAVQLPRTFLGYSTNFSPPTATASSVLSPAAEGPIRHKVELFGISRYFRDHHGFDPRQPLTAPIWLSMSEQSLLELTRGKVFHDGLRRLTPLRRQFAYYPRDLWLYLLACQWKRIGQEEPFIGRTGIVGDDLGSRILAARLVRDLMRLSFLMERQYAPYSKWFGTAFARLRCARRMTPPLQQSLAARTWRERQGYFVAACEIAARMHNALRITEPLQPTPRRFHERPFSVIAADRFADAIFKKIRSPEVRAIRAQCGAVDQFSDSTDLLDCPALCAKLRIIW